MITMANSTNRKNYKLPETQYMHMHVSKVNDTAYNCTLSINNTKIEFPIAKQDIDTLVEDYVLSKNDSGEYEGQFIKPFDFFII